MGAAAGGRGEKSGKAGAAARQLRIATGADGHFCPYKPEECGLPLGKLLD